MVHAMAGILNASTTAAALALPDAWPAPLVAVILTRRRALLDDATGDVLDLAAPAARALVRDAAFLATGQPRTGESGELASPAVVPQPGSFGTIVSVAGLVHFADLPLALKGITYLLHPQGELRMLEPIGRPGLAALLLASLDAGLCRWHSPTHGLHINRDVPAAVRAEGLTISDIERFAMPTSTWPLRWWMQATALFIGDRLGDPAATAPATTGSAR
jgi:hypothetical protein